LSAGLARTLAAAGRPDLTPEQWAVLSRLWEQEGLHQSRLAVRVGKDRHNLTRILNLMDKHGLVARRPDPHDARRQRVFLTQAGRDLRDQLIPRVEAYLRKALAGLTQDDYDRLDWIQRRIWANLEQMDTDHSSDMEAT
jgi:DNA-binding MarR family transcriptional regulator